MSCPKGDGQFILDTDASEFAIGAVLSQIQDGQENVIAYASRTMNKAERNYCVTDKELLAVRYFVEYFHHYLLGRKFIIRSDHQALKWLMNFREPKGRIARWIEVLSAYDYEIQFRSGACHGNADSMSRYPNNDDCDCADEELPDNLKCEPCRKCRKRADDMQNTANPLRIRRNVTSGVSEIIEDVKQLVSVLLNPVILTVLCIISMFVPDVG